MIIEKILKQLTPERVKKEIETVQKIKLPPELQKWVRKYEKVGKRSEFFWKFIYQIYRIIKPFNLSAIYQNSIIEIKFLIVMFIILLDDIADKTRNKTLLNELLKIPLGWINIKFNRLNQKEKIYLTITINLWDYIKKTISKYPRYKEFKDIFNYDINQTLNAMKYSYLINEYPYLINKTEYWLYSPHTLQGMINCTLDLMCLSKFNIRELGRVREIFWRGQKMARISNCLSTWERELNERDLTSGIFVYSLSSGLLDVDIKNLNKKNIIAKINHSKIEGDLKKEWQQCYDEINYLCRKIKSINSTTVLGQLEKLLLIYLIAEKYRPKIK
ncbi:hypothetical protein COS93_01555 [bacterium (Candidatus Gribaldobacteria) CG07_land_8_20_14_0_80_33_18]|uniref:Uncharacterized protein n=1 Tax=bacterium (Candidatus Gribaldobacteria) CG07_land_8_20_14_0_80_33_18 TaxID=2014272 RepID=A0A2M6Z323_9BACT|nr:MAG: hypothetical protein COU04_00055 [bacterium (Candidatus Gribaldobacteria) CG10_big_fil_rev_8_21_14_0_10_33_41]PIU46818.1 MAG: hypothetical protein COS93_01555 [bacterium (Candidatus Gribaldobacteria) CG07_land_8_20_14_0_80_33_18]PJA01055.1 MAG: hypothetical protein COX75_00930 [bacterium (Candidatus Gribaldobacteria) CG_4_10_14_0_2_um_filter_33_15]PJB08639.1 MAG: hypothetical protein CO122_01355 [bacterium (Candidatus Gribaldobacteria) CG_4_9_14_3_um_filter_33_9]